MLIQLVYWSLVGWCGTVPRPRFPNPPSPDPWPWWKNAGLGIIGGIAGGLLVGYGLGLNETIATSFGALAAGRITSEIGGSVMGAKSA